MTENTGALDPWATPAPATPAEPKLKRYLIKDPDDLTLGQAMGIKAATGVDVFDPETTAHQFAAMVWYAGRADKLTFAEAMAYSIKDFDLPTPVQQDDSDPLDPELDAEQGPTPGYVTPSGS